MSGNACALFRVFDYWKIRTHVLKTTRHRTMSPNYQRYEFRMNSMRRKSILLLMLSAVNVSGCHNGSTRSVQRPRIFSNPFRRQAIVVNPGIETVETPGAVVVEQQGGVAATQTAEPSVTTLQPRQGGAVTSVVPSFDEAQQPIGSGVKSNLDATRTNPSANDAKSIMNSLAPPAEAPQVIMEAPPLGAGSGTAGKSSPPSLSAPIDSSTGRASGSSGQEEPRLEAIEPRKGSSAPGGSSSPSTKSSANGTPKTSWRTQQKFGEVNGRTTYQASSRRSKSSDGTELGELD